MKDIDSELIQQVRELAATGATIKAIAEQLGINHNKAYSIIRDQNIESPSMVRRRNRHEANQKLREEKAAVAKANRIQPSLVVQRYSDGETLEEIGLSFGLSRERVRQIITESGHSVSQIRARRKRVADEQIAERRKAVSTWIEAHKGCTPFELETHFGEPIEELSELLTPRLRALILMDEDGENPKASANTKWTKEQILFALQQAAKKSSPLTREAYDRLVESKAVVGPVGSRIVHIFTSWSIACAIAGVEPGEALRNNYEKEFSTEALVEALAQFIVESESLSTQAYDNWRSQREGLPSSITIRLKFGSWTESRRRALQVLRASWTTT
jgi:hypothetical protein